MAQFDPSQSGDGCGSSIHKPEKILKNAVVKGVAIYLVKYSGLSDDCDEWVREEEIEGFENLIEAFNARRPSPTKTSKTIALKCREKYFHNRSDRFVVEKIVDKRYKEGRVQYKCKYKGFPASQNNWEFFTDLYNHLNIVKQYEDKMSEALESSQEASATLFNQGWKAVKVLGIVDEETRENRKKVHYLVLLKNRTTEEQIKKVIVPEECGKGRKLVEKLVKDFHG